jgi:hypothetical protein
MALIRIILFQIGLEAELTGLNYSLALGSVWYSQTCKLIL